VVAIETRDQLPSFDVLTIKLKEEGERKAVTEERSDSKKAFVAAQMPKSFAKQKKRKDIVCFTCGKKGHIKAQCSSVSDGKKMIQHSVNRQSSLLNAGDVSNLKILVWCLYNGATSCMCCKKELFINCVKHTEKIGVAYAGFLQAEGKGDVKIYRLYLYFYFMDYSLV